MKVSLAFVATCLVGHGLAAPYTSHAVHERVNELVATMWSRVARAGPDFVIPMRIGLKQQNLAQGAGWLYEVSDPSSSLYGQHWSPDRVRDAFRPSDETISAVRSWLEASGIALRRTRTSRGMHWIHFNATVREVESMLKTEYYIFQHDETRTPHIACDSYKLPEALHQHVDLVLPTVHFDVAVRRDNKHDIAKRQIPPPSIPKSEHYANPKKIGKTHQPPKHGPALKITTPPTDLGACDTLTTLDCLRYLYRYHNPKTLSPANSFGIVEYTPQAYVASDLDKFFGQYAPSLVGQRPILASIDGGYVQTSNLTLGHITESNLDLQYGMGLTSPVPVTLYQAGDGILGASFNNFLDAIDGSYCTYAGGDDPRGDSHYPDPAPGGYKGTTECGVFTPAKVISTSYVYDEHQLPLDYATRQCNEYMKLGLMGVTVLYPSGDDGVAGNGGYCLGSNGNVTAPGTPGNYNPTFPATCPWVTAVGASQVIKGTNVIQARASGVQPEMACMTVIRSGGGFSNKFGLPSYQGSAVSSWFSNYAPTPSTNFGVQQYNASQQSRGVPDVAANGLNYAVSLNGNYYKIAGTSASTPVFGSLITAINNARMLKGKGSVGFLNPVLYKHPGMFLDVTQGSNPGCASTGFDAVPGWDPVTGLGTPNFFKMKYVFMRLP